jgi:hypothetical protein
MKFEFRERWRSSWLLEKLSSFQEGLRSTEIVIWQECWGLQNIIYFYLNIFRNTFSLSYGSYILCRSESVTPKYGFVATYEYTDQCSAFCQLADQSLTHLVSKLASYSDNCPFSHLISNWAPKSAREASECQQHSGSRHYRSITEGYTYQTNSSLIECKAYCAAE